MSPLGNIARVLSSGYHQWMDGACVENIMDLAGDALGVGLCRFRGRLHA